LSCKPDPQPHMAVRRPPRKTVGLFDGGSVCALPKQHEPARERRRSTEDRRINRPRELADRARSSPMLGNPAPRPREIDMPLRGSASGERLLMTRAPRLSSRCPISWLGGPWARGNPATLCEACIGVEGGPFPPGSPTIHCQTGSYPTFDGIPIAIPLLFSFLSFCPSVGAWLDPVATQPCA